MRKFKNPHLKNSQDFCKIGLRVWICHHWDFPGSADWIFLVCFHFFSPVTKKKPCIWPFLTFLANHLLKLPTCQSVCSTVCFFCVCSTQMWRVLFCLFSVSFRKELFLFIFPWSPGPCWITSWWMDKVLDGLTNFMSKLKARCILLRDMASHFSPESLNLFCPCAGTKLLCVWLETDEISTVKSTQLLVMGRSLLLGSLCKSAFKYWESKAPLIT